MTTINTIQDLLDLLRSQPGWAKELRSILLTDELLALPATVALFAQTSNDRLGRLEETLALLTQTSNDRLGRLEETVALLAQSMSHANDRLGRLEQNVGELNTRVTSIESKVGRTGGRDYERRAEPKAHSRAHSLLGFPDPRVALGPVSGMSPQLSSAISRARTNAARTGTLLPDIDDYNDFHNADIIVADGASWGNTTRYALFEASVTLEDHDISRARDRADSLADTLAASVTPVAIADTVSPAQQRQAEQSRVTVIIIPDT